MNWLLLKNSLVVSALTTLLALSLGLLSALCTSALPRPFRNLALASAIVALALPPFLVTNSWLHFLGHNGVWRSWLPFDIFSLGGTVWILALLTWPITFLLVFSAWQQLEPAQLESDPAVTGWALFRALLWPMAQPALGLAAALTFILSLNNFAVPAILQTKVSTAEAWVLFNTEFDTVGALKLSWPLLVFPILLLALFPWRKTQWPRLDAQFPARLFRAQLGPVWFWLTGLASLALCFLSVVLPLLQLALVKRTWTELPGAIAAGHSAIFHSFLFPALSATLILFLALFTYIRFHVSTFPGPNVSTSQPSQPSSRSMFNVQRFLSLLWLPFLIPGTLLGIALIHLFNHPWSSVFYQSAGIVLLAFSIRYFALGWTAISHSLDSTDPSLTDAAVLDGANRWQLLRHIQWPQISSHVAAIWYILFLLCLWDVESMLLVMPPGTETLALRIFNFLHYGHNGQVNALCLTLLLIALAPLLLWQTYRTLSHFTFYVLRFTFYVSRFTLPLLALLLLPSCAPPPSDVALKSHLFSTVHIIGTRGVGVGQLNKPRSVAVDARDNLYVVDMTGRVQKFSPDGAFLLSWQMPQTDLGKPKGLCRDLEGNIVVLEPHYQRVNVFSPEGKLVSQWGHKGTNFGQFTLPRAVAINRHNEIYVSEYTILDRVQRFSLPAVAGLAASRLSSESAASEPRNNSQTSASANSTLNSALSTLHSPTCLTSFGHSGTAPGDFNRPEGLCVDAQDQVYVADSCNHRIQIFSREGKLLRAYGKPGSGPGELSYPYDICVDAAGRQYVCEFGNSRIQVFDANDHPIEIIGGPGAEPGQFSNPWGVALDSAGNLYVADSQNHRVQKLIRNQSVAGSQSAIRNPQSAIE